MSRPSFFRRSALIAVAATSCLALAACSAPAEDNDSPVAVTVWHTYSDAHATAYEEIVTAFNESQDKVKVTAQPQPFSDFDSKVMQAVRNGNGPDIIVSSPSIATQYIDAGLVADLAPLVADPENGVPNYSEDIVAGRQAGVTQWGDGAQYLYPLHSTGPVYFYNKTMFDELGLEAPTTWSELETVSRTLTEHTGAPAFGFDDLSYGILTIANQQGQDFVNEDGSEATFDSPEYARAIDWVGGLVNEGVFRLVGGDQYFSNPFGAGAVSSYIGASAGYPFVEMAVDGKFEVGVAPLPQEGPVKWAPEWGGDYLLFASDDRREAAAFEFITFFTSPSQLSSWDIALGAVPASAAAQAEPAFQSFVTENAAIAALSAQLPYVAVSNAAPGVSAAQAELATAIEQAITGQASTKDALAEAARASNAFLK